MLEDFRGSPQSFQTSADSSTVTANPACPSHNIIYIIVLLFSAMSWALVRKEISQRKLILI
jgi:hypothetical protein